MKQLPIIISHYTLDTQYAVEVENLRKSLDKFNLEYWIEGIKTLGTWRHNSNYCAEQIRKALIKFPNRNILRVDADAVFTQIPTLFQQDTFQADIAAHVHDFRWHKNELLGGTLYFRNTEQVRSIITEWAELACKTKKEHRNGDLLQELLTKYRFQIKFGELPATYCKIFDLMREVENPVIVHYQASRRFKGFINRGEKGKYIHACPKGGRTL